MTTVSDPIADAALWASMENAATDRALADLQGLRADLAAELLTSSPASPEVPMRLGAWEYRHVATPDAWALERRSPGSGGPWRRIHEIALSADEGYFDVGVFEPSDDGRFLALSVDRVGDERFGLVIHDVERDRAVCHVPNVVDVAWAAEERTLLATIRSDAPYRAFALLRIDAVTGRSTTVWDEPDRLCRLSLRRSDSGAYLFLDRLRNHSSKIPAALETRQVRADRPGDALEVVAPAVEGVSYQVEHRDGDFLLRIDDVGPYFRIVRGSPSEVARSRWEEVVPHRPGVAIAQIRALRDHPVLLVRASGLPEIEVRDPAGELRFTARPDETTYSLAIGHERLGGRPVLDHDADRLRITFSSFVTPTTVEDLDVASGERVARWQGAAPGHDASRYVVERLHLPASDGTPIPVSAVRRRDAARPGPLLLYGYGAYGFPQDPSFDPAILRLVDRGATYAIAHVRGGSELGAPWHDAARRRTKRVSVEDFVSVAQHLIDSEIAERGRVVSSGQSAGGALVTAALNLRPDLFAGVVALVPLADLLACQSDPSMPFSINERQEWGDPVADESERRALEALCPTTNATESPKPPVLVTAALHDGQVRYWQPARYVEALRGRRPSGDPVLVRVMTEGGHHGPSRAEPAAQEQALELAFILDRLGLADGQADETPSFQTDGGS